METILFNVNWMSVIYTLNVDRLLYGATIVVALSSGALVGTWLF